EGDFAAHERSEPAFRSRAQRSETWSGFITEWWWDGSSYVIDFTVSWSFGEPQLHTPARAPKANAYCERLVGTIRRECLDFMIPLGEKHLRRILAEWVPHYNQGRPHLSLGPGIPEAPAVFPALQGRDRHSFAQDCKVVARAVL